MELEGHLDRHGCCSRVLHLLTRVRKLSDPPDNAAGQRWYLSMQEEHPALDQRLHREGFYLCATHALALCGLP